LQDLARLHRFLATRNRDVAKRAVRTIRHGMRSLEAHPEIGRPVDEMPPQFREWFIPFGDYGYVSLYHYDGETVAILAIRHAREAGYGN